MLLALALLASLPQEPEALFDGTTLDGWVGDERYWSVEDGAIVGRSTADVPLDVSTYLAHEDATYSDFELTLDYRLESGNSGVHFRSRRGDGFQVEGYQADLDAPNDWTGGLYEQGGRGVVNRRAVRMLSNGPNTAYELLGDPQELSKVGGPGEWHTYRIRAVGTRIAIWIDDVLTCELDDREPGAAREGLFAMQMHAGPPMEVRFRDIRVRRLVADSPSGDPAAAVAGQARWIWNAARPRGSSVVRFERTLRARGPVARATLWATCDDGVELAFDDQVFAGGEDWRAPFRFDFTRRMRRNLGDGKRHRLTAECWNAAAGAGLIARLEIEYEDGTTDFVETDRWWRTDGALAVELGFYGVRPWGVPEGTSSGVPDLPLAASRIQLPPGFEANEILRVPREFGSWAAMTVDDEGRLICAAEDGPGLYRVTLNESGTAMDVEALSIDVHAAQGLLAVGRDLYIVRNALPPEGNGLYRARDADGDGGYESLDLLTPFEGGGEHGPHAVRLAPDGEHLELIAGNSTAIPENVERFHLHTSWHEDQLLPALPDTFGHGNQMHLHGGWLGRCDLDGEHWEILCARLRNPYDFAYDGEGERFTFEADMEWSIGTPWYRAPRILHLVPGAEYGWRRGSGKVDDAEPDSFGNVCETGPASPVGMLHGDFGGFHGAYGRRLYAGDWTRGTIYSVTLGQNGRTFTGTVEPFAIGTPFPVTDMEWLPDGSMAVVTGGRGRRSALYRIRCVLDPPAIRIRDHNVVDRSGGPLARRVAFELDGDVDGWSDRALVEREPAAQLALARVGGPERVEALVRSVAAEGRTDRHALRVVELALARFGPVNEETRATLRRWLEPALAEPGVPEDEVKLVELLTYLGSERVVPHVVPRLENAETQERLLDLAMALRCAERGWTDGLARRALDVLHRDTRDLVGGRSVQGYVERIRAELAERVASVLDGEYAPPEGPTVATRRVEAPTFVQEWTLSSLAGALPQVAGAEDRAAGRRAFERSGCFVCHRVGDEGGGTGPDLTGAGARFTARDLLIAVLEPSRDVSDQYRDTEVWTNDGEVFLGRLVERGDEWITLRLPPSEPGGTDGELVDVAVEDAKVIRPHPNSRMPAGSIDGLHSDEIVEMLAWLLDA